MSEIVLILSDIHHRTERAEKIISAVGADKNIFLGDYQDQFGDSHVEAYKTALWLKNSLTKPNRIHLAGNHCISYAYPNNLHSSCSGWQRDKQAAIDDVLTNQDWNKLKLFHVEQGWLFTHAGLHPSFLPKGVETLEQITDFLTEEAIKAIKALGSKGDHWMFRAGRARGGRAAKGGVTWLDANDEFESIPGLQTVQGHTPQKEPRWEGSNLFLDTHTNHYAILKDGKITTHRYADL